MIPENIHDRLIHEMGADPCSPFSAYMHITRQDHDVRFCFRWLESPKFSVEITQDAESHD